MKEGHEKGMNRKRRCEKYCAVVINRKKVFRGQYQHI